MIAIQNCKSVQGVLGEVPTSTLHIKGAQRCSLSFDQLKTVNARLCFRKYRDTFTAQGNLAIDLTVMTNVCKW